MIRGEETSRTTRRGVLSRSGWLALVPMLGLGHSAAPLSAASAIRMPEATMKLRRVLERDLSDGKLVTVTREWHCDFALRDGGIIVTGEQTFVDVDAPAVLAPIADIERSRKVTGFLPAVLDAAGLIVSLGTGQDDTAILRANATAAAMFASMPPETLGDADPAAFMAQLASTAATAVSRVPSDLFFPVTGEWSDVRPVALPGGATGEIEVVVSATARETDGSLKECERMVHTRLPDRERRSREHWSMAEL